MDGMDGREESHLLSITKHLRTQSVIGPYIDQWKAPSPVNRGLKLAPPSSWYWPWMQGSILRQNHIQGSRFLISSSPFECMTESRWTLDKLVTKQGCFAGKIQSHSQSNVMGRKFCNDIKIRFPSLAFVWCWWMQHHIPSRWLHLGWPLTTTVVCQDLKLSH